MRWAVLLLALVSVAAGKLIFLAVIWRHGDRAPADLPYPNDKNGEDKWPRGWDQLTNKGMQQCFEHGNWLRNKYTKRYKHIKPVFDREEVYVRSTESERALASAQAVMAGLFPPKKEFGWSKKVDDWQPTPIHSNGKGDDPLLRPTSIKCPAYTAVVAAQNANQTAALNKNYASLYSYLRKNSGMQTVDASNVDDLNDIQMEIGHGLPQPSWVTDDIVEKLGELRRILRTSEFNSKEKAHLRGGYLLNDWVTLINNAANGVKGAMKTVLYSAHDRTLSSLMYAFGIGDNQLVPYAASVIAELHRGKEGDFVKLFYKNNTHLEKPGKKAVLMTIPGCSSRCPLATFNSLLAPMRINSTHALAELCKQ